jgi:hypothetical protein
MPKVYACWGVLAAFSQAARLVERTLILWLLNFIICLCSILARILSLHFALYQVEAVLFGKLFDLADFLFLFCRRCLLFMLLDESIHGCLLQNRPISRPMQPPDT